MNFRCKFRHHPSIPRPRFPIRVQNFGDLVTFSVHYCIFIFWMSAIFLLPVCLTYWPRKYTTRVDPHVDNSHQVRSWYDHTLPSYSVFVWWYVTWPWPFDLEQLKFMAGHVTNLATKLEYPMPIPVVKVDRRIRWHYITTILRLRIGAWLTRYRNCKFHNFARTISWHADGISWHADGISRHADGISRYSVPPSAGSLLPLAYPFLIYEV